MPNKFATKTILLSTHRLTNTLKPATARETGEKIDYIAFIKAFEVIDTQPDVAV